MAIKRGTNTIRREHARNYTHKQAQRRLDEAVAPFNQQVENSLAVDAVEIDYYHIQQKTGIPCTCEQVAMEPLIHDLEETNIPPIVPTKDDDNGGIKVKFQDDEIFGDSIAEKIYNDSADTIIDVTGDGGRSTFQELRAEGDGGFADGLLGGGSVDCGVCYRTGFQPPYKAYGKQRFVFTNYQIESAQSYRVNTTKQPHTIEKHAIGMAGYVMFKTLVPKYFKSLTYSIRDNLVYLVSDRLFRTDGEPLRAEDVRSFAGREMEFLIKADCFTHVVLEFELEVPRLLANISGEVAALDYERLVTIGDINVILPPSLAEVENGDILIIKKRNLALKVRDKDRKITADKRRLEWSVSTRVLQPTEALRNIAAGFKLY